MRKPLSVSLTVYQFKCLLIWILLLPGFAQLRAQSLEEYATTWKDKKRARFVTYHYQGNEPFAKRGYVSDRPAEWSSNLGGSGSNEIVDPFFYAAQQGDTTAKHVVIMVHGYGALSVAGGRYYDREAPFFTSVDNDPHETGNNAWFDTGASNNTPRLHHYLRKGDAAFGFDPDEWVVLAVTLNILPDIGMGLSILENAERLTALMDVLWANYHPYIKSIAFVSHSTGSAVVKSILGEQGMAYSNSHPWLAYVDDHINLAGALGGTPSVMIDPIAMNSGLGQQLLYGIQHPDDYKSILDRYTAPQSVSEPFRKKKTYRWPEHINVLSIAGVWDKGSAILGLPLPAILRQSLNGNPFSGNTVFAPYSLIPVIDPFIFYKLGKSDGVVPNLSVIERTQYAALTLAGLSEWHEQVESAYHYDIDWDVAWVMPSLGGDMGGGRMAEGLNQIPGDLIPSADRERGTAITYAEIGAEHNGMLTNEYLLRVIKRRLGHVTVQPHVKKPVISHIEPAEGPLAGGNTITIHGDNLKFIRYIQFGETKSYNFSVVNENQIRVAVPAGTEVGNVPLYVVNTAGENHPQRPLRPGLGPQDAPFYYLYKGSLAAPEIAPAGGEFDEPVAISLVSATAATQIYYSWTNPLPGPNSTASQLYTEPFTIPVNPFSPNSSFTLYARAVKTHYEDSPVASATFSAEMTAPAPKITVALPNVPDGTARVNMSVAIPDTTTGISPTIIYTLNGSDPDISSQVYSGPFNLDIGSHVIKARTIQFGYHLSPVSTQEYTVYDPATGVSNPVITPFETQSFAGPVTIRMENYTEGAIIRYTISSDGSLPPDPTPSGEGGITYEGPFVYNNPGSSFYIKARAFKDGQSPSAIIQSGQITQNAPITRASTPSVFVNFLENPLRQGMPEGWEGTNGGGGTLSIGGSFASLVLDDAGDQIVSAALDVGDFPNLLLRVDISRSGAGAAPLLKVEVSDDGGQSWTYASLVGTVPATSFEQQTFAIPSPGKPIRLRFTRVNTSGGTDGNLSVIRFRNVQLGMLASQTGFDAYTFYNDVRVRLESITTDPGNPTVKLPTHIVYTLDGSQPDYTQPLESPQVLYATSFPVSSTAQVKALAFNQSFLTDSDPVAVTLRFRCAIPDIAVLDAVMADEVQLLLTSDTEQVALRYTLDGSFPGISSSLYQDTLVLEAGTHTLNVRAFREGYEPSEVASRVIRVEESTVPVITQSPQSLLAVAGEHVVLRGKASAFPDPAYQWYKDDLALSGATADSLVINGIKVEDAGMYQLAAINRAGTTFSEEAEISVVPELVPPLILVQPASLEAEEFGSAILSVQASGRPTPDYQWYKDGEPIQGANTPYYALYQLSSEDAGSYTVRVRNAAGEAESEEARVSIQHVEAPFIKAGPHDTTAVEGSSAYLAADVENAGSGWYVWLKDGKPFSTTDKDTLFFQSVSLSDSGNYQLVMSNLAGTDTSGIASLRVFENAEQNKAPIVPEIIVEVQAGNSIDIDVLQQVSDPDGDTVKIIFFTQAALGQVALNADQRFVYTPPADFQGEDAFSFVVQDSRGATTEGTVKITTSSITFVEDGSKTALSAAIYPNPATEQVVINFQIRKKDVVHLRIHRLDGSCIEELWSGALHAGQYNWKWDVSRMAAGMYICALQVGEELFIQKLLVDPAGWQ